MQALTAVAKKVVKAVKVVFDIQVIFFCAYITIRFQIVLKCFVIIPSMSLILIPLKYGRPISLYFQSSYIMQLPFLLLLLLLFLLQQPPQDSDMKNKRKRFFLHFPSIFPFLSLPYYFFSSSSSVFLPSFF